MKRNSALITTLVAAAMATLALPAASASPEPRDGFTFGAEETGWTLEQPAYYAKPQAMVGRSAVTAPKASGRVIDDFAYVGGDTGWQLKPHKLLLVDGRIVHSDECDHAIRQVKGPSAAEVDAIRNISPGA